MTDKQTAKQATDTDLLMQGKKQYSAVIQPTDKSPEIHYLAELCDGHLQSLHVDLPSMPGVRVTITKFNKFPLEYGAVALGMKLEKNKDLAIIAQAAYADISTHLHETRQKLLKDNWSDLRADALLEIPASMHGAVESYARNYRDHDSEVMEFMRDFGIHFGKYFKLVRRRRHGFGTETEV
jgi:hypothetical protein